MAGLDPSIILGSKPIETPNPLDMMTKALTMKELAQKSQMQDRDFQAQNAVRDAYKNNTVTAPDGSTSVNMRGVVNQVMQTNPQVGQQLQQTVMSQDLARQQAQQKSLADKIDFIHTSLGQVHDQASLDEHNSRMAAAGIVNPQDPPPAQWGPQAKQWIGDAYGRTMDVKTKLEQANKQTDQTTERAKANASLAEAGLPTLPAIGTPTAARGGAPTPSGGPAPAASAPVQGGVPAGTGGFTPPLKMQQKAMEDYTQAVNGSRQEPDALRALNNIASAKTLTEISKLAPGGDLNKLNPQQTKTAIAELVKMVTGGVPSDTELKEMSPDNLAQKYAGVIQSITNKSQPANAGEFLQQGLDYAKGIQGISAKTIKDRANDIADLHGKFMGPEGYQKVKGKIAEEFKRNSPEAKAPGDNTPLGATAKTKAGIAVVYKGNGVWAPQ